jgi:hypothetical protein
MPRIQARVVLIQAAMAGINADLRETRTDMLRARSSIAQTQVNVAQMREHVSEAFADARLSRRRLIEIGGQGSALGSEVSRALRKVGDEVRAELRRVAARSGRFRIRMSRLLPFMPQPVVRKLMQRW